MTFPWYNGNLILIAFCIKSKKSLGKELTRDQKERLRIRILHYKISYILFRQLLDASRFVKIRVFHLK